LAQVKKGCRNRTASSHFPFLPLGATRFLPAIPDAAPAQKAATRGGQGDRVDSVMRDGGELRSRFDPIRDEERG
jgi:hypothetical protein